MPKPKITNRELLEATKESKEFLDNQIEKCFQRIKDNSRLLLDYQLRTIRLFNELGKEVFGEERWCKRLEQENISFIQKEMHRPPYQKVTNLTKNVIEHARDE